MISVGVVWPGIQKGIMENQIITIENFGKIQQLPGDLKGLVYMCKAVCMLRKNMRKKKADIETLRKSRQ